MGDMFFVFVFVFVFNFLSFFTFLYFFIQKVNIVDVEQVQNDADVVRVDTDI